MNTSVKKRQIDDGCSFREELTVKSLTLSRLPPIKKSALGDLLAGLFM